MQGLNVLDEMHVEEKVGREGGREGRREGRREGGRDSVSPLSKA